MWKKSTFKINQALIIEKYLHKNVFISYRSVSALIHRIDQWCDVIVTSLKFLRSSFIPNPDRCLLFICINISIVQYAVYVRLIRVSSTSFLVYSDKLLAIPVMSMNVYFYSISFNSFNHRSCIQVSCILSGSWNERK